MFFNMSILLETKNITMIIKIKNLRLKTILGVYEWEKDIQREIIINAIIQADINLSAKSDDIADTIDYDKIVTLMKNVVSSKHYNLIEKMVADILDIIMEDKRIKNCQVEIDKIGAVEDLESFSVTDFRERK